jgi:lipid II:glycine glycyltransferase (peptidoglycan interpeptide bridge formation enzyme)
MVELIKEIPTFNTKIPIFAHEGYLKAKSDNYGWFKSERFLLPFIIESRLIFKRLIFTTDTIYLKEDLSVEDEKAFLNDIVTFCTLHNICDFIYKAQANAIFNTYPDGSEFIEWASYESALDTSLEELFAKFRSKDRNTIRKAIKSGVIVRQTKELNPIYENIKETFERQNSIFYPSLEYLESLQKNLPKNIVFFVAEYEKRIQGTAVILYNQKRAYYFYGGSSPKPINGSINLLQYKILDFCYEKGIEYYDLMGARSCVEKGSKFEAIQKFKSRFGRNLKKGYAFHVIIKPIKFILFTRMVTLFLKLKGSEYQDPIDSIKRCHEKNTPNL